MTESIYHLNKQGKVVPVPEQWQSESLTEKPFADEKELQELVANHPELLSCEQMSPDDPRRWILIKQEQGISDTVGGGIRWSLDLLIIDQDAIPTLVEVKRSSNSEIRRKIVGQMLDYAAHAQYTLEVLDIRRDFEESRNRAGQDPDSVLAERLGEHNADEFWQRVETNLRVANLRLLFVADGIPNELAREADFLNEQMPNVQVLAVEIKQCTGSSGQMWKTRVVDRASLPSPQGTPRQQRRIIDYNEFLLQMPSPEVEAAARRLLYVAWDHNADVSWDVNCVSIRANCPAFRQRQLVAWLYVPCAIGWMGTGGFVFGAGNGGNNYSNSLEKIPSNLRGVLEDWADQFSGDAFAIQSPFPTVHSHKSRSVSHEAAAANIDVLADRLENVLRSLQQLEVAEG